MDQQVGNPLVDNCVRLVNQTGGEIGVTMLVSGCLISGLLTPNQRYDSWEKEVLSRAHLGGGGFSPPSLELGPLTPEEGEAIRDKWEEKKKEMGLESDDEIVYSFCCLRNPRIFGAIPGKKTQYPLLLVKLSDVAAFTVGATDTTDPGIVDPLVDA